MITDADWNELQAIVKTQLDEALRDVVGGGVPSRRPLGVQFTGSTFEIVPGVLYAGGLPVRLGKPGDAVFTYATQPDFPSAPGAVAAGDLIYVDAWEREVSFREDPALQDPGLNGADTCTRTQTMLQIKRAPTGLSPELTAVESDARNPEVGNALLGIGLRRTKSSTDILDPAADEVAIDQPIGNFLFRVEIHDVQGPANNPTSITLKWSSENAAEAYASGAAPPDYKGSDWAYEFHGPTGERLGVPVRSRPGAPLAGGRPATEPDKTQLPWVRRCGWLLRADPRERVDRLDHRQHRRRQGPRRRVELGHRRRRSRPRRNHSRPADRHPDEPHPAPQPPARRSPAPPESQKLRRRRLLAGGGTRPVRVGPAAARTPSRRWASCTATSSSARS